MADQLEGTRREMAAAAARLDIADGYPKRGGAGVGKGPFTKMPAAWDGDGDPPAGWTGSHVRSIQEHPTDSARHALPIKQRHRARLRNRTVDGRTLTDADFKTRDATWTRTTDEAEPTREISAKERTR